VSYFITGTDTAVGKTYVTRLLLQGLRASGVDAVGCKPVACGDRDDADIISAASGGLAIDVVNPVFFKSPLAPYVAGLLENRTVDPSTILNACKNLASAHDMVLVEGAGGWEVPIVPAFRISDLASALGLPVIVVAANRLGALNHILLTVQAIQARGLRCAGIILNQLDDELDTAMITNKGVIEDLTGLPLIDHVIHGQDCILPEALQRLAPSSTP
jgi:dethiobiotin synthetase